jgi:thioredoxin-like negative regulator of GroEL
LFPDALAAREESHLQAMTVYDLLILALSRQEHYSPLPEIFDKAMKFSYENNHIWRQFSLALIAAGKHDHALSVLRQCHTMAEADSTILFDAAKLCINHLHMVWMDKPILDNTGLMYCGVTGW